MALMLENQPDKEKHDKLLAELTGPFRTIGKAPTEDELNAPAWWHGEEAAYEQTMAALAGLPQRGR